MLILTVFRRERARRHRWRGHHPVGRPTHNQPGLQPRRDCRDNRRHQIPLLHPYPFEVPLPPAVVQVDLSATRPCRPFTVPRSQRRRIRLSTQPMDACQLTGKCSHIAVSVKATRSAMLQSHLALVAYGGVSHSLSYNLLPIRCIGPF